METQRPISHRRINRAQAVQYEPSTDIINPRGGALQPGKAGRIAHVGYEVVTPELKGWGYDALVFVDFDLDEHIAGHYLVSYSES